MTANGSQPQPAPQPAPSGEHCIGCKFFHPAQSNVGFCRRYPPTVQMFQVQEHPNSKPVLAPSVQFPIVSVAAWCGEFVEKSRILKEKAFPV